MIEFRTKIDVIDTLLGYNVESSRENPFKPGYILIIRGGPGSGKTTLGLQILSRFLDQDNVSSDNGDEGNEKENDVECSELRKDTGKNRKWEKRKESKKQKKKAKRERERVKAGHCAIYVSLESDPKEIIERAKSNFDFFQKGGEQLNAVNAEALHALFGWRTLKTFVQSFFRLIVGTVNSVLPGFSKMIASTGIVSNTNSFTVGLNTAVLNLFRDLFRNLRQVWKSNQLLKKSRHAARKVKKTHSAIKKDNVAGIIFIDSLNALLMQASQLLGEPGNPKDPRLVVIKLCNALRKHFSNFIIICSSEFHNLDTWQASGMSESFICDAEIVLESEPIAVPVEYIPNKPGSVGYSIFKTLDRTTNRENSRLETRSFIRVTKLRNGANQSRRCSYDIGNGKGLAFYETYPGDGQILLFNENIPQRDAWQKFFKEDVPHLYPTLRYETFDRSSLQNTFSIQRHFNYIPKQTDLYLSSFDNFWISWYGELNWKWAIVNLMHMELRGYCKKKLDETNFPKAVNDIHQVMHKQAEVKEAIEKSISKHLAIKETREEANKQRETIKNILTSKTSLCCLQCVTVWSLLLEYLKQQPGSPDEEKKQGLTRRCLSYLLAGLKDGKNHKQPSPPKRKWYFFKGEEEADEICNQLNELLTIGGEKAFIKCRARAIAFMMNEKIKIKPNSPDEINKQFDEIINDIRSINLNEEFRFMCDWKKAICGYLKPMQITEVTKESLFKEISLLLNTKFAKNLYQNEVIKYIMTNLAVKDIIQALTILARVYCGIIMKYETFSLLREIPEERIKLFGERNSEIIKELETSRGDDNRPIHRPDTLFLIKKQKRYVSIPYDANIGLFVARKDMLKEFGKIMSENEEEYADHLRTICKFENYGMDKAFVVNDDTGANPLYKDVDKNIKDIIKISRANEFLINTWQEMIALLDLCNKKNSRQQRYYFLMETQSASTFYSTFLEILWNCGGDFIVGSSYTVAKEEEAKRLLFRALLIFGMMFHYMIIPFDATYDLDYFTAKYNQTQKDTPPREDWVFARHWYSTLIDILSAKTPKDHNQPGVARETLDFYWKNDKAELELMPFPVSLDYFHKCNFKPKRFACWGDWHLGISSRSENVALGIDLINNLMSSQRICERAEAGACLPTVEAFYKLYGSNRCIKVLGRPEKMIPAMTYQKLRKTYFENAKSRSQIFDYQHCILEIDSLLKYVYSNSAGFSMGNPAGSDKFFEDLKDLIDKTITNIKEFKDKAMQFNII